MTTFSRRSFVGSLATSLALSGIPAAASSEALPESSATPARADKLRIIAFGAHPDDCELSASGMAAMWAQQGHAVKFVAMTNGDIGHFAQAGGPLARRRRAEVEECARILGITTEVMDIHDGELMPSLENRRLVTRLIRDWEADIVLAHRPYDYHPDHRYVGVLVQDATVVVAAPFFEPYTETRKGNPAVFFYSDPFVHPYPFQPDVVVGFDAVADKKWACIRAMPSQMADKDSWQGRYTPGVPEGDKERADFILARHQAGNAAEADKFRPRLTELYGAERARSIRYAEAFELCEYGRRPDVEELKAMFLIPTTT